MRFLFYLGHPAHFHNVKVVAKNLIDEGHEVLMVAREKDVLFKLLDNEPFNMIFLPPRKGNSKWALIATILKREYRMLRIARTFKPDLLIGTDIVIAHVARMIGAKSIILNEDDVWEIPFFTKYGIKYCDTVLSPQSCGSAPYDYKTIKYPGFHELAYLHPEHFEPDRSLIQELGEGPFFILRFSSLDAHHDENRTGITDEIAEKLIAILEPRGRIFITSERPLKEKFERFRIGIHPKVMHHALYYAKLYIGDSQTMAAEAAVLGTPSIRFNDFVGRLGYLEELEKTYGLTFGFKTNEQDSLFGKVREIVATPDAQSEWEEKRRRLLQEKINVANYWKNYFIEYLRPPVGA